MYIRRKVFSVLDTEVGERLFSLGQREFTGETKRRNKALKRQYLEKMGEADGSVKKILVRKGKSQLIDKIDLEAASKLRDGRLKNHRHQELDHLDWKKRLKRRNPEEFKDSREIDKEYAKTFKNLKKITADLNEREAKSKVEAVIPKSPKPTTLNPVVVSNPNPEVVVVPERALVVSNSKPNSVVPEKALVVSNQKPAIKTESKLSKLAKNKYAKGAAGLLVLGGTAAGGYYLLNKKNKKDKEDKE